MKRNKSDELNINRRREGILLTVVPQAKMLTYEELYREMSVEVAGCAQWDAWDSVAADGLAD